MGHRIVCEIAWQDLTAGTKAVIKRALADNGRYRRFYDGCVWPDQVRDEPEYQGSGADHYVNIARSARHIDMARDCPGHCVVKAIRRYAAELASRGPRLWEPLFFLAHYVGDVHQPMHAAYEDDLGGNGVGVRWFGRAPRCRLHDARRVCDYNLHRLWDDLLLGEYVREGDWLEFAHALHAEITTGERAAWTRSEVLDWAQESFAIVRTGIYPAGGDEIPVGARYVRRQRAVIERRLKQAGVRLAAVLNDSLSPRRAEAGR